MADVTGIAMPEYPDTPALEHANVIRTYEVGTWGPPDADLLMERDGRAWRN